MIRFTPVEEIDDPLTISIGLSGGSGTGKTYSALRVARGIATAKGGGRIGFVDTENRRALHYRDAFPEMAHFDMQAVDEKGDVVGFPPERWIDVIDAAEAAEIPVLVIDSFSHSWEGVQGVLDLHATMLDRLTGGDESKADRFSQLAWASVKPRYRRLVDRIVRARLDIVLCTRAKPVMQKWDKDRKQHVNAFKTKTRRPDVPWNPASDADLMFELTAMMILDPARPGCPVWQIKCADQLKGVFDPNAPLDESVGKALVEWSRSQKASEARKAVLDAAREAAQGGKDALNAHYKTLPEHERRIVMADIEAIKQIAIAADERRARPEGDLFPRETPLNPEPSPEDLARAEQEARRAIEEQDRKAAQEESAT